MLGWISSRIFMGPAQRGLARRGVPIYTYHRVGPAMAGARDPYLNVSPRRFDEQLAALKTAGFSNGTLDHLSNQPGNPRRSVVLTFDDGCQCVLEHASPILQRHQFTALQFLVAGSLGGRNQWDIDKGDRSEPLMDASQVRDWLAAGNQIGSHSLSHPNLRHLDHARAQEEIGSSKKLLEDQFGVEVRHFCYPYGSFNRQIRDLVMAAGYQTACTVAFGVNPPELSRFELRRIIPLSSAEMLGKIGHRLARRLRGRRP